MANDVYLLTHDGLTMMVSARAATRVLDDALRAEGHTPESIDSVTMEQLLLGPVLGDLEGILPREGLKRNLRELANKLLREHAPAQQNAEKPERTPPQEDSIDLSASFILEDGDYVQELIQGALKAAEEAEQDVPVPKAVVEVPAEAYEAPVETDRQVLPKFTAPVVPPSKPVKINAPPLAQEVLESMVLSFAQIDQIKLVAAVRADGEVAVSRGGGFDVKAMSRMGIMGLNLLRRSGKLNSYFLSHSKGHLFLLPFGQDTLFVVGSPELNVGAVFTALSTLKEDI